MLIKISRQNCLHEYPVFPTRDYDPVKDEEVYFYPTVHKHYILTLSSKSFKGHVKQLALQVLKLTTELGSDKLAFLGDTGLPWLSQDNDYKPAKEAQQYLLENKVGKRFNGALEVDRSELINFIKHLSWLTRCNASLPYIYFTDPGQNFLGHFCKYGNLHISTLNEKTDDLLKIIIDKANLQYLGDRDCYNAFGKTSAIAGRRISI